jgi:predicted acylesterase/phospholipase RssA
MGLNDVTASTERRGVEAQHPELPFECIALLLQGGGALGAYQGGVAVTGFD